MTSAEKVSFCIHCIVFVYSGKKYYLFSFDYILSFILFLILFPSPEWPFSLSGYLEYIVFKPSIE